MHKIRLGFRMQTDHQILAKILKQMLINEKKRVCQWVDSTVSAEYRVKIKESEKIDKVWFGFFI